MMFKKIAALLLITVSLAASNRTTVVVFSCDRPLEFETFLTSFERFVTGEYDIHVIWRARKDDKIPAYKELKKRYPQVQFHQQKTTKEFKQMVMRYAFAVDNNKFILFAVDDIIITRPINLDECCNAMSKHKAYSFQPRLGFNIKKTFSTPHAIMPPHKEVEPGLFSFISSDCKTYPFKGKNSVDMCLYRKTGELGIKQGVARTIFNTPNTFEANWQHSEGQRPRKILFYAEGKLVNIPLNIVREDKGAQHMNAFTTDQLLQKFNEGLIIDIDDVASHTFNSTHINYMPKFVKRTEDAISR